MFLTSLLSPFSVMIVKAVGFCQELLPSRFEVVIGRLLKTQVFCNVMLCC